MPKNKTGQIGKLKRSSAKSLKAWERAWLLRIRGEFVRGFNGLYQLGLA